MSEKISSMFNWFNRQNTVIIIFILSLCNYFGIALSGGEEQYLAFAKQYMDPAWMPNSFTLNHPAGGNLVFQVITGFLLRYLTFEQMAALGRVVNFLLYAFPLALIFRRLRISNVELVFLLQVLFFAHQSLYAGEWIYNSFEEKSVAYIFVFWSLYYLLKDQPLISIVFSALATYFHFLVGGWMFAFVFIYFVLRRKKFWPAIFSAVAYGLIVFPFIIYLYKTYMVDNPAVVDGINTNAVYAYWRLRQHVGIFHELHYFLVYPLGGVLITLAFFIISIVWFRKIKDYRVRQLNTFNIIIFAEQFLFAIIGIFDKNGVLMKTYPYRTNSLCYLVFLIEITLIIKLYLPYTLYRRFASSLSSDKPSRYRKLFFTNALNSLLILIFLTSLIPKSDRMIKNASGYPGDPDVDMLNLIDYVRKNTPGSAVFIFPDSDDPVSFIRRAERERFVVVKFTPTKSRTIAEWYKRALLKERLKKDISLIDSMKTVYQIDYLVSDSSYTYPSLSLVNRFGPHNLYQVR